MFKKGDFVINTNNGICEVTDIVTMNMSGTNKKRLVGIIKTLYLRKQERVDAGKKNTALDERYFKLAENHLHSELAFALQIEKANVNEIILKHITNTTIN